MKPIRAPRVKAPGTVPQFGMDPDKGFIGSVLPDVMQIDSQGIRGKLRKKSGP